MLPIANSGPSSIAASLNRLNTGGLVKAGREVWILATYNPIVDENGKPFKVVAFATDVTKQKLKAAELEGQIAAIGKSQAVAEFGMDGKIITAER